MIADYVSCVFNPMDVVEVRALSNGSSERFWHHAWELPGKVGGLKAMNEQGWNIYVGVAPRPKRGLSGDANIELCRCLFCDFDGKHFPDGCTDQVRYVRDKVREARLPVCTMLIDSGHGCHCYWRLDEPVAPDRWKRANTRLSSILGSDSSVCNPERIMRLPDLMNHKPPPALCSIVEHDCSRTYIPTDFAALREPERPCIPSAKPSGDQAMRAAAYAEKWETLLEGEGRNQAAYIHMKALVNDMGVEPDVARQVVVDWNRHNTPPLSERELDQVIASALKYANKNCAGCKNTTAAKPVVLKPPSGKPSSGVLQRIEDSISGKRASIAWLWPEIDRLTNALLPASLTLICGEPGSSKSFMALETAAFWHERGIKVAVLETEETLDYHLHRLLAQRTGLPDLVVPRWCKAHPEEARKAYADYEDFLDSFGRRVTDNNGQSLSLSDAVAWTRARAEDGARIAILDPVTALGRQGMEAPDADRAFIHDMQRVADDHQCSIVLVTHPTKEFVQPALEHISGGSAYLRFIQTVIWLYSHRKEEKAKTSYVETSDGLHSEVLHDRSLCILKARHGRGTGYRIACNFTEDLRLKSHGVIVARPEV